VQAVGPELFTKWMCQHIANDHKFGRKVFRYHPRSDEHSKKICRLVLDDLVESCPVLKKHLLAHEVVANINAVMTFPNGKVKTLDLAIGEPEVPIEPMVAVSPKHVVRLKRLRMGCEAKQCMTEHSKTKPRIFDELSSSHEIVHQGDRLAIAAGIVVVNIARQYASPTRQTSSEGPIIFSKHKQPDAARNMIEHLKGLIMRSEGTEIGFDAFATIVIDCDNTSECKLHTELPAPLVGERHHYQNFISDLAAAYASRFG
jgi:hypothetical protein